MPIVSFLIPWKHHLRNLPKTHKLYFYLSAGFFACNFFILIGIKNTIDKINSLLPKSALNLEKKQPQYIYIDDSKVVSAVELAEGDMSGGDYWTGSLSKWWIERKRMYVRRLLEIAKDDKNTKDRIRAIDRLARLNLQDYEYRLLSQIGNVQVAAALARTKNVDKRFFKHANSRTPPQSFESLKTSVTNLLVDICKTEKDHHCLKYFVTKSLYDYSTEGSSFSTDLELERFNNRAIKLSEDNFLPLCLEALVHHCSNGNTVLELVKQGGLTVLYDLHKYAESNMEVNLLLVKLLEKISLYPEVAEDLYVTGWFEVIFNWSNKKDVCLSIPGNCMLANLDDLSRDLAALPIYGKEVYQLHPTDRQTESTIDVVLVHGLLGGVHCTWKQRNPQEEPITLFGITSGDCLDTYRDKRDKMWSSKGKRDLFNSGDEIYQTLTTDFDKDTNSDDYTDFEMVFSDIPQSANMACHSRLSLPIREALKLREPPYAESSCWPLDWLAHDCNNIRLLAVNYETKLTDWLCWCPNKETDQSKTIRSQAYNLLDQLILAGLGIKPIIWIVHSMGGLLLKHMLLKAWNTSQKDHQKVAENSKAIIFLSTPHMGSPLACLNDASRFLLLPSSLVNELRMNSPDLIELHEKFLMFLNEIPVRVTTFNESKRMKITSLEIEIQCVPPSNADSGVGIIYEIPLGHMDICKPDSKLSFIYQKILEITKDILLEVDKKSIKSGK